MNTDNELFTELKITRVVFWFAFICVLGGLVALVVKYYMGATLTDHSVYKSPLGFILMGSVLMLLSSADYHNMLEKINDNSLPINDGK